MRTIAAFIVNKILARAAAEGLDSDELLRVCGLERERLGVGEPVLEGPHYLLWETIAERLGARAPGFVLRYAQTMSADDYGALGLSWKTAHNFQEGLERTVRYLIVMTNTSTFELDPTLEGLRVIFHRSGERRYGLQRANEAALAEMLAVARGLIGDAVRGIRVGFQHPAPDGKDLYDEWFGVPVAWEARWNSIEFERATLDLIPPHADAALSEFILQHLDQAVEASAEPNEAVQTQVRSCIVRALPDGAPKMEKVAKNMGMSPRTLHRRLEEAGCNFKTLVEGARRDLAEQLLRSPARPLGEVAFLTGFSEPSAFHRAFKRWTGRTPADYRAWASQGV